MFAAAKQNFINLWYSRCYLWYSLCYRRTSSFHFLVLLFISASTPSFPFLTSIPWAALKGARDAPAVALTCPPPTLTKQVTHLPCIDGCPLPSDLPNVLTNLYSSFSFLLLIPVRLFVYFIQVTEPVLKSLSLVTATFLKHIPRVHTLSRPPGRRLNLLDLKTCLLTSSVAARQKANW